MLAPQVNVVLALPVSLVSLDPRVYGALLVTAASVEPVLQA
jgi:hypothetical protein